MIPKNSGFTNSSRLTLAFNDANRTLTLGFKTGVASSSYNCDGSYYEFEYPKTSQIPDVEGVHYFYIDGIQLKNTQVYSEDLYIKYTNVAILYWDADNKQSVQVINKMGNSAMDPASRKWSRQVGRSVWKQGLDPKAVDMNGFLGNETVAYLQILDGAIISEDLVHEIADGAPQKLFPFLEAPVLYREGPGNWRKIAAHPSVARPADSPTGRGMWNEWTGSAWQLTELQQQRYAHIHLFATGDITHPIFIVMGLREEGNRATAGANAEKEGKELLEAFTDEFTREWCFLASFIFRSWTVAANYAHSYLNLYHASYDLATHVDRKHGPAFSHSGSNSHQPQFIWGRASEDIEAGDIVGFKDPNPGGALTPRVFRASANSADPIAPIGFVLDDVDSSEELRVQVFTEGATNDKIKNRTKVIQYLSDITPGKLRESPPDANQVWQVGYANANYSMIFHPKFIKDNT